MREDLTVGILRFSLIPGVTERSETLDGLAVVLSWLLRHVNSVCRRCFHQTCFTGPILRLMGALVVAQQSSPEPQAGSRKILHVAVVGHCSQEEEEKQEEEKQESCAVVVLQILSRWVPVVWARSTGAWLVLDCVAEGWG